MGHLFKYNLYMERTILYLIYSPFLQAFKIGITNLSNKRYAQHRAKGWVVVKYWYFQDRKLASCVEKRTLELLRTRFPETYLKKRTCHKMVTQRLLILKKYLQKG